MRVIMIVLTVLLSLPTLPSSATPNAVAAADRRPDIVFVLVDDMTEADWPMLPQTRRLLPTTYPNYINTDPLCCPSRASILRGQYPHNHGTISIRNSASGGWQSFQDQENDTIAVTLQDAGYRTGLFGKYFNGYLADSYRPVGWDVWFGQVDAGRPSPTDNYFDWQAVDGTETISFGTKPNDYSTDVFRRRTLSFIKKSAADQPLFAYVAPFAPIRRRSLPPGTRAPVTTCPCQRRTNPAFWNRT